MLARATETWHIASVSWGKDSLAMLLMLIEAGEPLDEVVFFDTGMEFQAIYDMRDKALPLLDRKGIRYTELHPKNPMWWDMFCRPVRKRGTGDVHRRGYGWCGGLCRWGTKAKTSAIDRYAREKGAVQLVGIAADETERLERANNAGHIHPLAEWGVTEAEALAYCYLRGFDWMEGGRQALRRARSRQLLVLPKQEPQGAEGHPRLPARVLGAAGGYGAGSRPHEDGQDAARDRGVMLARAAMAAVLVPLGLLCWVSLGEVRRTL